ncbi:MAG TPA: hypothetical protein VJK03_03405 [Candidatus Nanoarchaeia archaeon]|nr:hypothetical protein [Candidatus Nanoarchaeia archaeon]
MFALFNVDQSTSQEYESRSRRAIEQFLRFVGLHDKMPSITFHQFNQKARENPLSVPSGNNLPLHVALNSSHKTLIGKYKLLIQERERYSIVKEPVGEGGDISLHNTYRIEPDEVKVVSQKIEPVVISANINPVSSYSMAPAETLHYMLRKTTVENTARMLTSIWRQKYKKKGSMPIEVIDSHSIECTRQEEAVVHAALHLFLEQQQNEMGVPRRGIERFISDQLSDDSYSKVPEIRKKMEQEGVRKVFQDYIQNSSLLFK